MSEPTPHAATAAEVAFARPEAIVERAHALTPIESNELAEARAIMADTAAMGAQEAWDGVPSWLDAGVLPPRATTALRTAAAWGASWARACSALDHCHEDLERDWHMTLATAHAAAWKAACREPGEGYWCAFTVPATLRLIISDRATRAAVEDATLALMVRDRIDDDRYRILAAPWHYAVGGLLA